MDSVALTILVVFLCYLAASLIGFRRYENETAPSQMELGYTIILPGIEGRSRANSNIARGLRRGGLAGAIEIVDWTTGWFSLFVVHLRCQTRNRSRAAQIAAQIVEYQAKYPGRPIHLIGHSGGSGMIALVVGQLPEGCQITTATLIASALSSSFPISELTVKTEKGVWSWSSVLDIPLLVVGTTIGGTFDGKHRPAAGAIGFRCADSKFHQRWFRPCMIADGHWGGHFGATSKQFVSRQVVRPLLETKHPDELNAVGLLAEPCSPPQRETPTVVAHPSRSTDTHR